MKYVCLIYHDEEKLAAASDADIDMLVSGVMGTMSELEKSGHFVTAAGLQSVRTATTLRHGAGKLAMTDGPFAETKECLGGFIVVEARDLNEALQLASRFPMGDLGTIEVRPAMDPSEELTDPLDRRMAASIRRVFQPATN